MSVISTKEALALKVYAQTLSAFERANVFSNIVTKQTIDSGKSSQFIVNTRGAEASIDPATGLPNGTAGATGGEVQTRALGQNILDLTSQLRVTERTIFLERPLATVMALDDFEKKMAHYNMGQMITGQGGSTMSNFFDRRMIVELDKASILPATTTQYASGAVYNAMISGGTTAEIKGNAILDSIFAGASILDGKDRNTKQRYFVTTNQNYYNLLQSQKAVNRDFNGGDNGSIATGKVLRIGDVTILRSNNISNTLAPNITTTVGNGNQIAGYLLTEDVIGVVEQKGLTTDTYFHKDLRQDIYYIEMVIGAGTLDPSSFVAITTGTLNQ